MKILKKSFVILGITIGVILILFLLNYARLNIRYLIHKKEYIDTFAIQGNTSKYVPQGLAYSDKYNIVLQTSYNGKHDVSRLYIIDFKTGELIKSLNLIEFDDSSNNRHVGGIATDNETVWITSDYEVNEYSLSEIIDTKSDYIKTTKNTKLPIRGDFCYYSNNTLWIGDFFLKPFYTVPDDNPLLMGYNLNNVLDYSKPDCIISLPKMVQGMTITPDNKFVFTSSFTYLMNSRLSIYNNVLEGESEYYNLNGRDVPYYKFNKSNLVKKITLPPMAEGLFNIENDLYILFESSSDNYSFAFPKVKKVIKYTI